MLRIKLKEKENTNPTVALNDEPERTNSPCLPSRCLSSCLYNLRVVTVQRRVRL